MEEQMTPNPIPLAQALARHMAAIAALDAVPGPEDYPEHLRDEEVRPSTNSPSRLAPAMRNSSKSCATYTLSKLKYGNYRTMATITVVSSSPPHVTSVRCRHDPPPLSHMEASRVVLGLAADARVIS
jgi:hypothetical protein